MDQEQRYVRPEDAHRFAARLLAAHKVPAGDAEIIASCLVRADLRGVVTHGIVRLPGYLDRVDRGLINAHPTLSPQRVTPVTAMVDGQDGFGFLVATRAMAEAIAMADEFGIGMAAAKASTHFGMASCYALQAVEAGMVALVFTNASRAMPPWGGREALLGTNPVAMGAPGGAGGPVVLDMSPAVAARGKIRLAVVRGEKIPLGYALDASGAPTTDPVAALDGGVVLPIGGPKGSGLSMFMDVFAGVLTGAAFGGDVHDQYINFDTPQNVGHLFIAMKPDLFVSRAEFLDRMDAFAEKMKAVPKAEGFDEILLPGELENRLEARGRREGIVYSLKDLELLASQASAVAVEPLEGSPVPLGA